MSTDAVPSEGSLTRKLNGEATIILVVFAISYAAQLVELAKTVWFAEDGNAGFITVAIALYLIYRQLDTSELTIKAVPTWTAFTVLACGAAVNALGTMLSVAAIQVLSLQITLFGVICYIYPRHNKKKLIFPILFLCFSAPLPAGLADSITQPLKLIVSSFTEAALRLTSIPVSRDGVTLQIGQYKLLVADACAGINILFTLEAIGLLYLYLSKTRDRVRTLIVAFSIPLISILANTLRVLVLCLITFYGGDEAGQGYMHGASGIVLFSSAVFLMIGLDNLIKRFRSTAHHE